MSLNKRARHSLARSPRDDPMEETTLWNRLPDACQHAIVAFSGANELCALDATSKAMQSMTEPYWSRFAQEQFGIRKARGKLAWRQGIALTQPKHYDFFELREPEEYDDLFSGCPHVATNGNLLVHASDDADSGANIEIAGKNAIVYRDGKTLSFIRTRACARNAWGVVICGLQGTEVIVTMNPSHLVATQGNRCQEIPVSELETDFASMVYNEESIQLLGSEKCLILILKGMIYLYAPGLDPLLSFLFRISVLQHPSDTNDVFSCGGLSWASEGVPDTFVFSCRENTVSVWQLDGTASRVEPVKDLTDERISGTIDSIAMSQSYTVLSRSFQARRIRVYDGQSHELLHCLCDIDEDDTDDEDAIFPLTMEIIGDLLVSKSYYGNALCIWQMRTGTLLRRHEDAFDHNISSRLNDQGMDPSCMVRLKDWGCTTGFTFCSCWGSLTVYAFPEDDKGRRMLSGIKRRERRRRPSSDSDSESGADSLP